MPDKVHGPPRETEGCLEAYLGIGMWMARQTQVVPLLWCIIGWPIHWYMQRCKSPLVFGPTTAPSRRLGVPWLDFVRDDSPPKLKAYPVRRGILLAVQLAMWFVSFLLGGLSEDAFDEPAIWGGLFGVCPAENDPYIPPPKTRDKHPEHTYQQTPYDLMQSSPIYRFLLMALCFGTCFKVEVGPAARIPDGQALMDLLQLRSEVAPTAWMARAILQPNTLDANDCKHLQQSLSAAPSLFPEGEFEVVFDSGASNLVSPDPNDFVGGIDGIERFPARKCMQGIAADVPIEGVGIIEWHFVDNAGILRTIKGRGYYMPSLNMRLCSPQRYFQDEGGGSYLINGDKSLFKWKGGGEMTIRYDSASNLPIARGFLASKIPDVLGRLHLCVTEEKNQNLSHAQKLLLKWHF